MITRMSLQEVNTLIEQVSKEYYQKLQMLRRDFPSKKVEIARLEGNIGAMEQVARWLSGVEQ